MADDKALMQKFHEVLAAIQEEIASVKAQYIGTPGPHLSDAEWSCVAQEARAYAWAYLCNHGVGAPALIPATVVEIAMSRIPTGTAQSNKDLMERFNRVLSAVEKEVEAIRSADASLTADEVVTLAERRVALRFPGECPLSWLGPQQVN